MRTVWKVVLPLALVLPMAAYVAGSLGATRSHDPSPRETVVIRDAPSSTPAGPAGRPPADREDSENGDGGGDGGDDDDDGNGPRFTRDPTGAGKSSTPVERRLQ